VLVEQLTRRSITMKKYTSRIGAVLALGVVTGSLAIAGTGSAESVPPAISLNDAMGSHAPSVATDVDWSTLRSAAEQTPSTADGTPMAADLHGQRDSVIALGSTEVGEVHLAPANEGTGFCWSLDLANGVGNPGASEASGCAPEFPADQVMWTAFNLGSESSIHLLGFASDAVDHLTVIRKSGDADRVDVSNGAFKWTAPQSAKDPGSTLQVIGNDGKVLASHEISQIYDRSTN
jgi:hypothetical protein